METSAHPAKDIVLPDDSEEQQQPHQSQQPSASSSLLSQQQPHHSLSYAFQTYLRHDQQEQNHWEDVCRSYRQYATFAMEQWANHQYRLHSLPEDQRKYLPASLRQETPEFQQRATNYKEAAIRNQFCLDCILRHAGQKHSQQEVVPMDARFSSDAQMSKVSSVLKSLARDWSEDGKSEREMSYQPLIQKVLHYLPISKPAAAAAAAAEPPRVCIPGAGVGRLACEFSALGYTVQGNEFSLYMLLASDFILNGPIRPSRPLQISPWMLESRNVHSVQDQLRVVHIPDVDPFEMIMQHSRTAVDVDTDNNDNNNNNNKKNHGNQEETSSLVSSEVAHADSSDCSMVDEDGSGDNNSSTNDTTSQAPDSNKGKNSNNNKYNNTPDFSMAAGEFVSIYSTDREKGAWDAVVACFFLDASPSIVEYLKVIYDMLRPGGYLFHFGPLLWHWSGPAMRPDDKSVSDYRERFNYLDPKYLMSVDLAWEEVREIVVNMGFEIIESSSGHEAFYTADQRSMMNMRYRCIMLVARKPLGSNNFVDGPSEMAVAMQNK